MTRKQEIEARKLRSDDAAATKNPWAEGGAERAEALAIRRASLARRADIRATQPALDETCPA